MEGLHIIGGLRYDQKELFPIHIITQYYAVKEKRDIVDTRDFCCT